MNSAPTHRGTANLMKLKTLLLKQLHPHRLSLSVYGEGEDVSDLAASVRAHGIRTPLTVLADERTVIKGKRRLEAAKLAGLERVPCLISSLMDKLQIEIDILEDNRSREKTNEQKAREFRERKRIEEALAKQRQKEGREKGTLATKQKAKGMVVNLPPSLRVFAKEAPTATLDTGKARDLAASSIGWTGRTGEKAEEVLQFAEKKHDPKLIALMNQKSVNAAHAAMKKKRDGVNAVPPFTPHYSNVWNFSRPTPGLGEDYPGRIPGDILRNLFWLYTRENDLVHLGINSLRVRQQGPYLDKSI